MINWGIIGLGNMANSFASSISEVKNSKLLGIASKNFLRLKSFGDKYNIEKKYRYNNYDEIWAEDISPGGSDIQYENQDVFFSIIFSSVLFNLVVISKIDKLFSKFKGS